MIVSRKVAWLMLAGVSKSSVCVHHKFLVATSLIGLQRCNGPKRTYADTTSISEEAYHAKLAKVLTDHKFLPVEVDLITEHLRKVKIPTTKNTLKAIEDAVMFWNNSVGPPKKFSSVPVEDIVDYNTANVNYVLSNIEPDLLLADPEAMRHRIKLLRNVGFLSGAGDIWRVFVGAPRAYFLQDWTEFIRKYYYVEHRMMEWLLVKRGERYPVPHPLVKHPKILNAPYEHIKTRHLFAVKTGLKEISVTNKLDRNLSEQINLGKLILTNNTDYLKYVAPFCSEEEYLVFEQYIADLNDEEDSLINELSELAAQDVVNLKLKDQEKLKVKAKVMPLTTVKFHE